MILYLDQVPLNVMPETNTRETGFLKLNRRTTASKNILKLFMLYILQKYFVLRRIRLTNQEEFSPEEIEDAEKFMRRTLLSPETKHQLMLKFELTRRARLAAIENKSNSAGFIIKKYPLLVDTLKAVRC